MKKKLIFAIATGFFAVVTVFNMNMLESNSTKEVSWESISVMAEANVIRQREDGGGTAGPAPSLRSVACWENPRRSCRACNNTVWSGFEPSWIACQY